jgi:hypothetical protein
MFDTKRFMTTHFTAREEDVPVPDLKDFFEPDEDPVWRVRGLTGAELGLTNQAAERNRNIEAILEGVAAAAGAKKTDAIKNLIGGRDETPDDVVKRMEMLVIASVSPECDLQMAVKLCKTVPVEFFQITTVISKLTGMGQAAKKKPTASGTTPPSGPA